jgi:hypothetical protein
MDVDWGFPKAGYILLPFAVERNIQIYAMAGTPRNNISTTVLSA